MSILTMQRGPPPVHVSHALRSAPLRRYIAKHGETVSLTLRGTQKVSLSYAHHQRPQYPGSGLQRKEKSHPDAAPGLAQALQPQEAKPFGRRGDRAGTSGLNLRLRQDEENILDRKKGEGKFYWKGSPGGWAEDLTPEQVETVENITAPLLERYYAEDQTSG